MTHEEISRLLAACSRRGLAGMRNRALIVVLWRGGLRISEALALRGCDVWLDRGELAVLHGKGDRSRMVGLDPMACAVVERWKLRRVAMGISHVGPLFCTISRPRAGGPLTDAYVRHALKRLAELAGVEKRVHPHGFRHTHAAELAREGVPAHVIRKQLGHSSLNTTARYIEHLRPREVIEAMQARDW